jgi:hypothetical protein
VLVDDDMLAPGSTFNDDVRRLAHDILFAYASLVEQVSFSSVIVSHPTPHEPYTLTVKSGVCVRVKLQISMTYLQKNLLTRLELLLHGMSAARVFVGDQAACKRLSHDLMLQRLLQHTSMHACRHSQDISSALSTQ